MDFITIKDFIMFMQTVNSVLGAVNAIASTTTNTISAVNNLAVSANNLTTVTVVRSQNWVECEKVDAANKLALRQVQLKQDSKDVQNLLDSMPL